MKVHRFASAEAVARAAAECVAVCARESIAERGRFLVALSGGSTPWPMLNILAGLDLDWARVRLLQVDERRAPRGHPDRNLTHLAEQFADRAGLRPGQVYAMPVTGETLGQGARDYELSLCELAGRPPVLDLVHLGMGSDGHTASLLPTDALLDENRAEVGVTAAYQGRERMSLTYPAINRARRRLWLVNGTDKSAVLERMLAGDAGIPAGRVAQADTDVFTDIPAPPEAQ